MISRSLEDFLLVPFPIFGLIHTLSLFALLNSLLEALVPHLLGLPYLILGLVRCWTGTLLRSGLLLAELEQIWVRALSESLVVEFF